MMKFALNLRRFDAEQGLSVDFAPAISIDHNEKLIKNVKELQALLGIEDMKPMAAGSSVKIYKTSVDGGLANQVNKGETIGLTKTKRELVNTINMELKKYRKAVAAEDIQKYGKNVAINMTDTALLKEIQATIKADLFNSLQNATAKVSVDAEATLQACLAALWGKGQAKFEDVDANMIYFVNPSDIADYLKNASVTLQTAFGLKYLEDFLGLGTVVVSPKVTATKPFATAKENLNGIYAPIGGEVASIFGLTADETGLVGMNHSPKGTNATLETLIMSDVKFYAEDESAIFVGEIGQVTP